MVSLLAFMSTAARDSVGILVLPGSGFKPVQYDALINYNVWHEMVNETDALISLGTIDMPMIRNEELILLAIDSMLKMMDNELVMKGKTSRDLIVVGHGLSGNDVQ